MEASTYYYNNLNEIKKSCEKLITETQYDIDIFRNEQQNLQQQIQGIVVENNLINSKLEELKNATIIVPSIIRSDGETRDDATREQLTNEAFYNIKTQIDYLQTENNDLRTLNKTLQKNIEHLKNEIQNYRNQLFKPTSVCEVKQKFTTIIKILETSIDRKNVELKEQSETIDALSEQNKQLSNRIERSEKLLSEKSGELEKIAEKEDIITKLQEQLAESERHNKELQKYLKISKQSIEKGTKREQIALQKVEEALHIAEAAEADKKEALKRERVIKEECDNIASTIGQVMDEAARKVENDMEAIKNKYITQEKLLNEEKKKLIQEIENQKNFNKILETRCKRFEQKYTDAIKDNKNLLVQLEQAAKALCQLEKNIYEGNLQQITTEQDNKIQQFVKKNQLLRERYTTAINDLTENFKEKINNLQGELARLKAENQALRLERTFVNKN